MAAKLYEKKLPNSLGMWNRIVEFAETATGYKSPLLGSTVAFLILFLINLSTTQNPLVNPAVWIALFAFIFFLVLWGVSWDRTRRLSEERFLRSRFKKPNIGIFAIQDLTDTEFAKVATGCAFPPHRWIEDFQSQDLCVETVDAMQVSNAFDVLVNPFGERYLESDIANMQTLKQIKEFVRKGGVFVSVGGLAFYYMYNPQSKIEGLTGSMLELYTGGLFTLVPPVTMAASNWSGTTTPMGSIILQPGVNPDASSLVDTWSFRNLGLRTTLRSETTRKIEAVHKDFADIVQPDSEVQEFRAIERCEANNAELVPIFKSEYQYSPTQRTHECYPVAAVRFGLGYFVICGMVVKEEGHKSLIEKTVVKICNILTDLRKSNDRPQVKGDLSDKSKSVFQTRSSNQLVTIVLS